MFATPPVLSAGSVAPTFGSPTDNYTFVVTYSDPSGYYASTSKLYIDSTACNMTLFNGVPSSALYVLVTTLSVGVHQFSYQFANHYGEVANFPSSGTLSGPTVDHSPVLSSGSVSPVYSTPGQTYTFMVNYYQQDGFAPAIGQVYIKGVPSNMTLFSGSLSNGIYTFQTTLSADTYNYSFLFKDILGGAAYLPVGVYSGPTVRNNSVPVLTQPTVSPTFSFTTQTVIWTVNYQDADGDYPVTKQILINGTPYDMTLFYGVATNALYVYSTVLSAGDYNYSFNFSDGFGGNVQLPASGTFSGPTVRGSGTVPSLSLGTVSPTYGLVTQYTFQVNYSDPGNIYPSTHDIILNGNRYSMTLSNGAATSATYTFQTTLEVGDYYYLFYYIQPFGGSAVLPSTGYFAGPTVRTAPASITLTGTSLNPLVGNPGQTFTYVVNYQNPNGVFPTVKDVLINGNRNAMTLFSGSAATAVYTFQTTLANGEYTYAFNFADPIDGSFNLPVSGSYSGPTVHPNSPPNLTGGMVTPGTGSQATSYTWIVNYQDPDNDPPQLKQVYIDGTPYTMNLYSGLSYNGVYVYQTTLSVGVHSYWFYFTDTVGNVTQTSVYSGPTVNQSHVPVLSNGHCDSPASVSGLYTFVVSFLDVDSEAPATQKVYIDNTPFDMALYSGNQWNGVYYYQSTLSVGTHNFFFQFTNPEGDTARLPVTGTYSGITIYPNTPPTLLSGSVSPASGTQATTYTYIVNYSDINNEAASVAQVVVDGTPYTMTLFSGDPWNATYIYQQAGGNFTIGVHNFYFRFADLSNNTTLFPSSGTLSGPTIGVNRPPVLSSPRVDPVLGNTSTQFYFICQYTHPDNLPPGVQQVKIDGKQYQIQLFSGDAWNGLYVYQTTLGVGLHNYSFYFTDQSGNPVRTPVSGSYSGPSVSNSLMFTNGKVYPGFGYSTNAFAFTVFFSDPLNLSPLTTAILLDGVQGNMALTQGSPANGTYSYYLNPGVLSSGVHQFSFLFTRGNGQTIQLPTTGTFSGPTVIQLNAPTNLQLSNPSGSQIQLIWQDNSSDEDGFIVQCQTNGSGWQNLATVGSNVTTYLHNASLYTYYSYRVCAYKIDTTITSLFTNTASTVLGFWDNTMGDFSNASDSTNFGYESPDTGIQIPPLSWLNTYAGKTGVLQLSFNNTSQGVKMTAFRRVDTNTPSNPWHRLRITYCFDTPANLLETMSLMLLFPDVNSYAIREVGGSWTGWKLQQPNTWYTLEAYIYARSSSGMMQFTIKNNSQAANYYIDKIEWDNVMPPAMVNPSGVPVPKGHFDTSGDISGYAFQQVDSQDPTMPTVSWVSAVASQSGVLALTFSAITQGEKITTIDLFPAPAYTNVMMKFKVYSSLPNPSNLHVTGILMPEKSLADLIFELGGYASVGSIPGQVWTDIYMPATSISGQTTYRGQFIITNNLEAPEVVYLDDIVMFYDGSTTLLNAPSIPEMLMDEDLPNGKV